MTDYKLQVNKYCKLGKRIINYEGRIYHSLNADFGGAENLIIYYTQKEYAIECIKMHGHKYVIFDSWDELPGLSLMCDAIKKITFEVTHENFEWNPCAFSNKIIYNVVTSEYYDDDFYQV
jgi:hypothetical protein